jgi:hypothetical protein
VKRAGIAICALAAAAALAGCGGSSSNSEPSTSTTPTSTSGSGSHSRLSASEWGTYETANKNFVKVTNTSIATFQKCGAAAGRTTNADAYAKCMGDTTTKAIAATQSLGETLHGFQPSVSGDCRTALNDYVGQLTHWKAILTSVDSAVKSASPGSSGTAANARAQYPQVQDAAKTFSKDCRPL